MNKIYKKEFWGNLCIFFLCFGIFAADSSLVVFILCCAAVGGCWFVYEKLLEGEEE